MKKQINLIVVLLSMFMLVGCSNKSLEMNDVTTKDVKHVFQNGVIENSQKVLINQSQLSILTYAGSGGVIGTGVGALIGGSSQGGIVGAVIGTLIGGVIGNSATDDEVEAYQVEIRNIKTNVVSISFLSQRVGVGTLVEYIVRDNNKVTNVNIAETYLEQKERLERLMKEEKRARKLAKYNSRR